MSAHEACWHLHAEPFAPGEARHQVVEHLTRWGYQLEPAIDEALRLVTSELVTNAVVHAGKGKITVTLRAEGPEVYVEVQDGSMNEPCVHRSADDEENGRGLFLVEMLSSSWGSEPVHDGKKVWALMPLTGQLDKAASRPLLGDLARMVCLGRLFLLVCLLPVA
ncbi:ATP-binding protein [Streptosporangium carneum]|uniref:Histidine kinase/HSP90-like ATPase domain-containing protein n=1 Tax=Streptosporangium carneum TaxID=47481 RepID=A0A9W6IBH3_9ACTN|nr:ATP-binding protein [Streptosporangium carneum]GLK15337.1 hypothetical protein GCM10017600_87500 [Streptosporangium carneum]